MRTILLLWGLCCLSIGLPAQNLLRSARQAAAGQIFTLEPTDARKLVTGGVSQVTDAWFTNLYSEYAHTKPFPNDLPPGHYMTTQIVGNQLHWTYLQVPNCVVYVENDQQHLMLKLYDLDGQVVEDALVRVGEQMLPFDGQTQTYKTDHAATNTLVEIEVDGNLQFFHLGREGSDNVSYPASRGRRIANRWLVRPFMGWVIKPVVFTMRLPYDLAVLAVKQRFQGWPGLLRKRLLQVAQLPRKIAGGGNPITFMVCSQPRYRPGDTVKVKAFVTDKGGVPIGRRLGVYLTDRSGRELLAAQLTRPRPGCHMGTFILTDSLNLALDRAQALQLRPIRGLRKRDAITTASFHYEDYELKQFTFALRADAERHWQGKPLALYLEAKDMNALTVPDARVRVVVCSRQVAEWRGDHCFLPDTLWSWSGNLDASGETRLEIPAHRFQGAAYAYQVEAECWSSDNERKTASLDLSYLHDQGKFLLRQDGRYLQADYLLGGESVAQRATMTIYRGSQLEPVTETVNLPARLFVNPTWSRLTFVGGDAVEHWSPVGGTAEIHVVGRHTGDSLHVRAVAASGLQFSWHLFEGHKEVATGSGSALDYRVRAQPGKVYTLNIHGTVGGTAFCQDYTYHCPKNTLDVAWQGPSTIYPGMTADIQVQVHDRRGKPVRKADLTAYAVNGRFEGAGRPSISLRASKIRQRRKDDNYVLVTPGNLHNTLPLDYATWAQRAHLDTLAWYHFLYPDSQVYTYLHPIEPQVKGQPLQKAEIAPFVVKDGAIQPVQVVYIDGSPVYFAWSNPQVPYAFPVTPGRKYMIEIRLPEHVVRIDTFKAAAGYKTILSIDLDHLPKRIKQWPMTVEATGPEQGVIEKHTFAYRNSQYGNRALIAFGERIFPLTSGQNILCGPSLDYERMNYEVIDQYQHAIEYEPRFEYDYGQQIVKMRSLAPTSYPKRLDFKPQLKVEDRPWIRDSLVAQWRRSQRSQPQQRRYSPYYGDDVGRTIFSWTQPTGSSHVPKAFILQDPVRNIVHVIQAQFNGEVKMPLGKWNFYILLDEDHFVAIDTLHVLPHGRTYKRLRYDASQVQDSLPDLFGSLIEAIPHMSEPSVSTTEHAWQPQPYYLQRMRPTSGRTVSLRGTVTDKTTGEPMPAAVVYCYGFGVGTYTDLEGHFKLEAPIETDSIVVRYLGYESVVMRWQGQQVLNISLNESSIFLDEVVVSSEVRRQYSVDAMTSYTMTAERLERTAMRDVTAMVALVPGMSMQEYDLGGGDTTSLVPAFPTELLAALEGQTVMRKDFRDNAIWQPDLRTDRAGQGSFRVRFPEDITRWDAYAVAVDRRGRAGATQTMIKSWKPLAGRLAMPRFLMAGDTCLAIGKVLNYTGDTLQLRRRFLVDGRAQEHLGECGPIKLDTLVFSPQAGADSLQVSYLVDKADGYGDGEELGIKVFPVGVHDASGHSASIWEDTVMQVRGLQTDRGPVQVHASTRMEALLLTETQHLRNYSHLCNEQLSSKLIGLLAEQQIFKSLDRPWHGKKDVERCIQMLEKRVSTQQGVAWGWWPGMKPEIWVSLHVTKALLMARDMGYTVHLKMLDWIPGIILHLDYKWYNFSNVEALQLIQEIDPQLDIRSKIERLDTLRLHSVRDQLAIMELRQKAGMSIDIDSLVRLSQLEVNHRQWWGNPYALWRPYYWYADLEPTIGAYRILRRAGADRKTLMPILSFLLETRMANGWGNTYLTAQVLHTLIPDIGLQNATQNPRLSLTVDGQTSPFPMDSTWTLPQAPGAMTLHKEGLGLVFFNAYQRWFNSHPVRVDSLFAIESMFVSPKGVRLSDTLVAGQPVTLRVTLEVKRSMEYLMLEVPIPAGCSYASKTSGYRDWNGYAQYCEYFREKYVSYYRNIGKGRYTIDVQLLPRYNGQYVLNCARAEQMYLPLLAGQNDVRRVAIR